MDYLHLYNHRIRMMNSAKTICQKCGSGYRGTRDPEEVLCPRCTVLHCQVPENIDEEFLRLVNEYHGTKLASDMPLPTEDIILIVEDILGHRKRLQKLETVLKERKQDKGRMKMMREIKRIKDEKDMMEERMRKIKGVFIHFLLTMPTRHRKAMAEEKPKNSASPSKAINAMSPNTASTPCSPLSPNKNSPVKNSLMGVGAKQENGNIIGSAYNSKATVTTTDSPPKTPARRSPGRKSPGTNCSTINTSPSKDTLSVPPAEDAPQEKTSPVKQAAAKFEEAAKRVKAVVTFASPNPPKRKDRETPPPPPVKLEVNNNTPVTASSSSEEDEIETVSQLKRSNSVRDRIKRFEDLQRRASTGSYDRKRLAQQVAAGTIGKAKSKPKSMMPLQN